MRIFVTGSSANLAAVLLPQLCDSPAVERVTGVDIAPPVFRHAKFTGAQVDIRDPRLEELLDGHHGLVHLACARRPAGPSGRDQFDVNVTGGHKVFHAARRAGIARLVYLSSAAVYGGGVHLSEAARLEPLPQLACANHHAHLERLLAIEFPDCVRLRPHLILGPNARAGLRRLLRLPCYVRTPAPSPLLQCVHEDDVARAIQLALAKPARGPFNLAVEDNFTLREAVRQRHRFAVGLPPFLARAGLSAASRWLGWDDEASAPEALTRTLLLNCRRAAIQLGWRSAHSAASVLAQS